MFMYCNSTDNHKKCTLQVCKNHLKRTQVQREYIVVCLMDVIWITGSVFTRKNNTGKMWNAWIIIKYRKLV